MSKKLDKGHVTRSPYEPTNKVPTGDANPRYSRKGTRYEDQAAAGEKKAAPKKKAAKKKAAE